MKHYPTLSRLEALEAVCRTGGFSSAADELALTQPAVSAQIRQLESEIGTPLVERFGKSARATPAGAALIEGTLRVMAELDQTIDRIETLQGEVAGPLRIGAGGTATTYLLPPVLSELVKSHPLLEPSIVTGNTPDMLTDLVTAALDFAVLTAPVDHPLLETAPFFRDPLVCIAPKAELRKPRPIQPEDLADRRLVLYGPGGLIRRYIDDWLATSNAPYPNIVDVESAEAQKSFVEAGFGWAIVSEIAVKGPGQKGRFSIAPLEPHIDRALIMVWRRDRADYPVVAAARERFAAYSAA